MNIIFFSTPAFGHLNSVQPVLKDLARRHRLIVYSTPTFRDLVVETGSEFREYPFDFSAHPLERVTADFLALYDTLLAVNEALIGQVEALLRTATPELVLHDSLTGFAKHACGRLGLKAVCLTTTLAYNPAVFFTSNLWLSSLGLALRQPLRLMRLAAREHRYRREWGAGGTSLDLFANDQPLNLVFTPAFFQPLSRTFARHSFVGPTIPQREAQARGPVPAAGSKPLAYISLGTIFSGRSEVLQTIVDAVAEAGYRIVVSTKEALRVPDGLSPSDWQSAPHWNQLGVLSEADLFINHGGINGVLEALWYGVPQLWVPQQKEQEMTARRAHRLGLGLKIGRVTPDVLSKAIRQVGRGSFQEPIAKARDRLPKTATGDAVSLIEAYGVSGSNR